MPAKSAPLPKSHFSGPRKIPNPPPGPSHGPVFDSADGPRVKGGNGITQGNGHNGHGRHEGGLDKRKLLSALEAFKTGNFQAKLEEDFSGIDGRICSVFNEVLDMNRRLVRELDKVNKGVGKEGKIAQRISMGPVEGGWSDAVDSINGLIDDLVWPTTEMSRVIGAVSSGDLSQAVSVEADGRPLKGEFLRSAKTVNTMVSRLSSFASEATRVAREVGSEGKLGGQAEVKDVLGP